MHPCRRQFLQRVRGITTNIMGNRFYRLHKTRKSDFPLATINPQLANNMNQFIRFLLTILAMTLLPALTQAQLSYATNKVAVTADMLAASSVYNGYTPWTAFDGVMDQNTGWCAAGGQNQAWLAVDFGAVRNIGYVRVFPDRYIATDPGYSYLDRFRVDVWSNGMWQAVSPLISTPSETWYPAEVNFATAKLRFWCESDGNGPQVKEIEIYGIIMRPSLAVTELGGGLQFQWNSLSNASYQLQSTTNLSSASWNNEGTPFIGTGGVLTNSLSIGADAMKFFRLQILGN